MTHVLTIGKNLDFPVHCQGPREGTYFVTKANDGQQALEVLERESVDAILLDLDQSGLSSRHILHRVRRLSSIPIVCLANGANLAECVSALEAGADDYVEGGAGHLEVMARLRAVMRRRHTTRNKVATCSEYQFQGWRLRLTIRDLVAPDGEKITLGGRQFNVLETLLRGAPRTLSRQLLIDNMRYGMDVAVERSADILISQLRKIIEKNPREPEIIKTVPGYGYRINVPVRQARGTI